MKNGEIRIQKISFSSPLEKGKAENKADDNFETVKLVWAAYESAKSGKVVKPDEI